MKDLKVLEEEITDIIHILLQGLMDLEILEISAISLEAFSAVALAAALQDAQMRLHAARTFRQE